MKTKIITYALLLFLFAFSSANIFGQESSERRPPREKMNLQIVQATIVSLDLTTRLATLRGSAGNLITVEVDEAIERLDEMEVGDIVTVEYMTYMMAEFRRPTIEELKEPLVILAEGEKAPKDMAPEGIVGALVKAVVTIEIINRPDMLVTVKGPLGNYTTIPSEDPSLIEQLNVGEVVILTYVEAIAMSLEKVTSTE